MARSGLSRTARQPGMSARDAAPVRSAKRVRDRVRLHRFACALIRLHADEQRLGLATR
jgi:hypothetical protein